MFWKKLSEQTRTLAYSMFALSIVVVALLYGANFNTADAQAKGDDMAAVVASPAAVFPANAGTLGAIPDGNAGTPPQYGAPLVVTFPVTGVSGNVTSVSVNMTMTHSWVGDVNVVLAAPGGLPSMVVVSRIGVTTATGFGDSSNYAGAYIFADSASGTNIWTVAGGVCGDLCDVLPGTYRTTAPGQAGQTNPAPVTSLNVTFAGLTPAQANGTWTLTFRDAGADDTGTVSAASLTIDPTGPAVVSDAPVDFNNDGRTDYVVVRNVGGGPSGQVNWFYNLNNVVGPTVGFAWGLASDFFITEDFDNDNKDDIAVWRPGAATVAAFYIFNSATSTVRVERFGQTGDDPTVVDDYNNDGSADIAVYRPGASAGLQSTWYYRTVANGPTTFVPWGINGDFPAPGDYDGNGSADFVIQRAGTGGQANFWTRLSTGATSVTTFGTPTDVIVPGDYDGDGKTDIATVKGVSGSRQWQWLSSLNGSIQYRTFGLTGDFTAQGDYDGDGKTDVAVWRPSVAANASAFYSLNSTNGAATIFAFGASGDYPVANYNSH